MHVVNYQFYYFNKDRITYRVIGCIEEDAFDDLIDFIQNGEFDLEVIVDNL